MGDTPKETRAENVQRAQNVEALVRSRIRRSITSGAADRRTLVDPFRAAEYASNALLHHNKHLLAEAAVLFARDELDAILVSDGEREK